MSIGWNYVGKLTPMRSNISRFSRGTITLTERIARKKQEREEREAKDVRAMVKQPHQDLL
jgi:hypothetical protein